MKWLITGGCGFIGRALIRHLVAEGGHKIRVFDNLSVGSRDDLAREAEFVDLDYNIDQKYWQNELALITGDIMDGEMIQKAVVGADLVVHLAANTGVAPSVEDPNFDCSTNVIGTLNVLEACRYENVTRMVFASSGAPLGMQVPPLHEEMAPHPASPYGASKLAGEGYCSAYFYSYGVETIVLRFGNVYGEGSDKKNSVVAKFIKQALAGETLEIYGDGSQTRDFIYIGDLVRALYQAATVHDIGGETFQIASSIETTVGNLAEKLVEAVREVANIETKVINVGERVGDVAQNFSNTSKADRLLKWNPKIDLEQGLRNTVCYFLDR